MANPLDMLKVTSPFGMRFHPIKKKDSFHTGIDFSAPAGTSVKAYKSGTVYASGNFKDGYGNKIVVDHGDGYYTYYAHLNSFDVSPGQKVKEGQVIGKVGSTGLSTGPHLHFAVAKGLGNYLNPMDFLQKTTEKIKANLNGSSLNVDFGQAPTREVFFGGLLIVAGLYLAGELITD